MKRLGSKSRFRLMVVFTMARVSVLLVLCWTASFYFFEWLAWKPAPLVGQLLKSGAGFILFGGILYLWGRFARRKQMEAFQAILDALAAIAKGDFRVSIEVPREMNEGYMENLVQGINNMAADLDKMEILRQEFISNVSHEIQSPLTSIGGFARVLKDSELTPLQREHYLDIIEQESVRLSRLSDSMLKLASLDSDKHPFHPVPVRLDKQLQRVILAGEPQWSAKSLEVEAQMDPAESDADADLLDQVWINLLHNAVKFTPDGGSIQITLRRTGEEAVVTFKDTGTGIPNASLPHIFERFYKADPSRTRTGGGSGLGLSISRKIVEMHGGAIAAHNDSEEGAVFTVTLPLSRTPPGSLRPARPAESAQPAKPAAPRLEQACLIR
ncbi:MULTISPECIES: cell wall metabolism sensor histidine kinase WalK [unclassified Paenibacillus]|uniref:sensor histidine kinase n=2 Tax=Paenibacillus TaxID=44249 RepID=UPI00039007C4|nr:MULTISPECIES: HAMP domain-containing sensor histidine kinase [unclassified Paenibacillus]CDN44692.1 Integral membrane sensor signal transduction histidine kinase [Paenibacillus sp. P22]